MHALSACPSAFSRGTAPERRHHRSRPDRGRKTRGLSPPSSENGFQPRQVRRARMLHDWRAQQKTRSVFLRKCRFWKKIVKARLTAPDLYKKDIAAHNCDDASRDCIAPIQPRTEIAIKIPIDASVFNDDVF